MTETSPSEPLNSVSVVTIKDEVLVMVSLHLHLLLHLLGLLQTQQKIINLSVCALFD